MITVRIDTPQTIGQNSDPICSHISNKNGEELKSFLLGIANWRSKKDFIKINSWTINSLTRKASGLDIKFRIAECDMGFLKKEYPTCKYGKMDCENCPNTMVRSIIDHPIVAGIILRSHRKLR